MALAVTTMVRIIVTHTAGRQFIIELCVIGEPLNYIDTTFGHNARHQRVAIPVGIGRLDILMPDRGILTVFMPRQYQHTGLAPRR